MKRVEFRLSMPGRASWNGRWSGEDRNYLIYKTLTDRAFARLGGQTSWSHRWSDGWCAVIHLRQLNPGEKRKKSDGFSGYDWMVTNILTHNSTTEPNEVPA